MSDYWRSEAATGMTIPEATNSDPDPLEHESRIDVAPQWKLTWWKFRQNRLAVIGAIITILIYFVAGTAEFFAPFPSEVVSAQHTYAPPQPLHLFDNGQLRPFVNGYTVEIEPEAMRRVFVVDPEVKYYVRFFGAGEPYKLLGLFDTDIHLIVPEDPDATMYLLGADSLGRDVLSRMIYGARVSMSVGLLGVAISFILGIILGGISGYYGGWVDNLIQRVIEFLRSIPSIPLWMGLAAALPAGMPPLQVYFFITIILSFLGWTSLARVVRGRFLALRTEDFVIAAELDGNSRFRTIWRHMVPSFMSHIIASLTLAIPGMILAETSLSFLGLGLRSPVVSWGVLLQDAQNIRAISSAPWLFWPGVAVVIAVLALNFMGDGLRDAADPYD